MKQTDWFLGLDWAAVPEELKEKTLACRRAFLRLRKAEEQIALWRKELDLAGSEFAATQSTQTEALNRWDPDKQVMISTCEEAPQRT